MLEGNLIFKQSEYFIHVGGNSGLFLGLSLLSLLELFYWIILAIVDVCRHKNNNASFYEDEIDVEQKENTM